jgi:hypothetical protein
LDVLKNANFAPFLKPIGHLHGQIYSTEEGL